MADMRHWIGILDLGSLILPMLWDPPGLNAVSVMLKDFPQL